VEVREEREKEATKEEEVSFLSFNSEQFMTFSPLIGGGKGGQKGGLAGGALGAAKGAVPLG
jgi:hypothetical protein